MLEFDFEQTIAKEMRSLKASTKPVETKTPEVSSTSKLFFQMSKMNLNLFLHPPFLTLTLAIENIPSTKEMYYECKKTPLVPKRRTSLVQLHGKQLFEEGRPSLEKKETRERIGVESKRRFSTKRLLNLFPSEPSTSKQSNESRERPVFQIFKVKGKHLLIFNIKSSVII